MFCEGIPPAATRTWGERPRLRPRSGGNCKQGQPDENTEEEPGAITHELSPPDAFRGSIDNEHWYVPVQQDDSVEEDRQTVRRSVRSTLGRIPQRYGDIVSFDP